MDPRKRAALVKPVLDAAVQSGLIAAGLLPTTIWSRRRAFRLPALPGRARPTRVELSATLRRRDGSASGWAGAAGVRLSDVDPAEDRLSRRPEGHRVARGAGAASRRVHGGC